MNMKYFGLSSLAGVLLSCLAGPAFASTIHVPADQPTIQAAINAAAKGDTVLVSPGTYVENINFGYNAQTGEYEDLVKAGVLDPTKVVRTALTNAGSIASLMLTTEALVSEIPEEKKAPMGGGHGGGGMEGMY